MKVTLENTCTRVQKVINVSYVWDREDKYLVITDDVAKKKYTANTWKGSFDMDDVERLAMQFAGKVLNWKCWADWGNGIRSQLVLVQYNYRQRPNCCCHNDEFYEHYKKGYTVVPFSESGLEY